MLGIKKVMVLVALLSAAWGGRAVNGGKNISSKQRELQIEEKLKHLNKPAVKSIKTDSGDIIDCVDIHKQPAFDHPLLKNHQILKKPSFDLFSRNKEHASSSSSSSSHGNVNPSLTHTQSWRKHGTCPEGTVPIRRVQRHHLINTHSLQRFGMKNYYENQECEFGFPNCTLENFNQDDESYHSYATLFTGSNLFTGAKARINVWQPSVEGDEEYSSGQIWIESGDYNSINSIEVGWIVNPSVYGDRLSRFFTYWTIDSGITTGCFDLICSGFVHMSREIALGVELEPSIELGKQTEISIEVIRDPKLDAWWLIWGTNVTVGYWPKELFPSMGRAAAALEWGGDVYSPRPRGSPRTTTQMGSGRFPFKHLGGAAYIKELRMTDFSYGYVYPQLHSVFTSCPYCYGGENYADVPSAEPVFFFGGPGRSFHCLQL